MKIIKHKFAWENDETHKVFWDFRKRSSEEVKEEVSKILTLCSLSPPGKILDVGCGLGLHLAEFSRCGFSTTGIEISDYAVEKAKKACANIPTCTVLKMRGSEITWINEFDLVLSLEHTLGFMELSELRLHFQKLWAALNCHGTFLLGIPGTLEYMQPKFPVNKWEIRDGKYILEEKYISQDKIKREHCIIIDSSVDIIHEYFEEQRYYTLKEILTILSESGIENIQIMRDLDGGQAHEGKDAFFFMAKKI